MFQGKKGPYILILSLVIILIFIFGFQYGKHVESTNKSLNYILSITPTSKKLNVDTKNSIVAYKKYINSQCGISFVYPITIHISDQASPEAKADLKDKNIILVNCQSDLPEVKGSSSEAKLDNKNAIKYTETNSSYIYYYIHNVNNKRISIKIPKDLDSLIVQTFKFIK